ncbi:MAG: hypothetical protein JWO37_3896 [Acidimicrobiales bacterium]|nr:hypothetical protein [Acidimicrobiales bacterium]
MSHAGAGWRWPAALFAVTVAVHLALVHGMRTPIIHTDEYAYLDIARYLAHGGRLPRAEYYPGYSLLLVPVAWLTRDPLTLYRGALVVNAVLAGCTTVLAYLLAARWAPGARRSSIAATAVVAAYPAYLLAGNLALSENLFVPAFLGLVLLVFRTGPDDGPARWAVLGVAGGGLLFVHPRALAVDAALVVAAALVLRSSRRRIQAVASSVGFVGGMAVTAAIARLLTHHVSRGSNGAIYRAGDVASRNLHFSALGKIVAEAAGQAVYIAAATVGLVALGLVIASRSVVGMVARPRTSGAHRAAAFCGLAFVAVLGLASLFLSNGERLDHWIYGRYVEGVAAPLIVLAVLAAGRVPSRLAGRLAAAGAVLLIAGGAVVTAVHHGVTRGPLVRTNVMGVDALFRATGFRLSVAALTALAVAGVAIAAALGRWGRPLVALLAVIAFAPSIVTSNQFLIDGSRDRAGQRVVARTIVALQRNDGADPHHCIGYDDASYSIFHYWNYRLFLPDDEVVRFDSRTGARPCSDLVISGRSDLGAALAGARLVVWEHGAPQGLWVLPGPLLDRLAVAHRLPG